VKDSAAIAGARVSKVTRIAPRKRDANFMMVHLSDSRSARDCKIVGGVPPPQSPTDEFRNFWCERGLEATNPVPGLTEEALGGNDRG